MTVRLPITGADFFPDASDHFEVQAATEMVSNPSKEFEIRKLVKKFSGDWPKEISGVMAIERDGGREGYQVKLPIGAAAPVQSSPAAKWDRLPAVEAVSCPALEPLWKMLIYAFIGGLILNIMPCVLPVIALKILGFVSEAGSSPRRLRALGGLYAVGVLLSFLVLAAIVIGIKAAGHLAGWGMQFGNPIFLVCLTTLVALVALNLFGVFEVTLGGSALDTAGTLASGSTAQRGHSLTACSPPCWPRPAPRRSWARRSVLRSPRARRWCS